MIKIWAEKELRNLKRIYHSNINCPEPLLVKSNILVMEFIGKDMQPAQKLRDADLNFEEWSEVYLQLLRDMRELYMNCKLVHADLSEYNLLYYDRKLYMIDVSQSIEHDHPHALFFLRRDCLNVNIFFKKKGKLIIFLNYKIKINF